MAGFESVLAAMGAVPKGAKSNVIDSETGKSESFQENPFGRVLRNVVKFQQQEQVREEKRIKRTMDQASMYQTLRESGYTPKRAYDAVQKNYLPEPEPEQETLKEKRVESEIETSQAKTDYYRSRIPLNEGVAQKKIELITAQIDKLKQKAVADPGQEQKANKQIEKLNAEIELINARKNALANKKSTNQNELNDILDKKTTGKEEMVPVLNPQGKPFRIPRSKLAAALKAGWKKR